LNDTSAAARLIACRLPEFDELGLKKNHRRSRSRSRQRLVRGARGREWGAIHPVMRPTE
jgi:hypothetical protein